MEALWIEAFRYHRWANLHLLDACADFSEEQLQLTAPGTFGPIGQTFLHLLGAEEGYLHRLGGPPRTLKYDGPFPGVAQLKTFASRTGDELIAAAEKAAPHDVIEAKFDDGFFKVPAGIVLIQALHHGNDHRTHICTILGHHGLTYGDMDVWAYGDAVGAIQPVEAT